MLNSYAMTDTPGGHRILERRVMEIEKKNSGFTLRMILIFPIALEMLYS